jgi:hypothetical protein
MSDPVNHPKHYNSHPSGVECITIVEHMGFCIGNAIKYLWRADKKGPPIEDLKKARWYIDREIQRREAIELAEGDSGPVLIEQDFTDEHEEAQAQAEAILQAARGGAGPTYTPFGVRPGYPAAVPGKVAPKK